MRNLYIILAALLIASCSHKVYPVAVTDSVRVEYRDRIVKVVDTAFVEIPSIREDIITIDTVSHLENQYAESYAAVSDGLLYHSLHTKPQTIVKPVEVEVIAHDTIYMASNTNYVPVEVEVEKIRYPKSYGFLLGFFILLALYKAMKLLKDVK